MICAGLGGVASRCYGLASLPRAVASSREEDAVLGVAVAGVRGLGGTSFPGLVGLVSLALVSSSPGSYFASHFIMGGEKFDSAHPEGYLFGENSDLNFLGNRPVAVRLTVCCGGGGVGPCLWLGLS